jgi:GT2 family glycosyltransferase
MSEEPLVSIVTVNYNQTEVTCALLDSIREQDYRRVEVIVVDNGSAVDPSAALAARYPEAQVIRNEHNLGFAGGNNLALPEARGEFFFFVNNDAELTPGCLRRLLALFRREPSAGIVSPLLCYYPENKPVSDRIQYAGMTRVHWLTGRNRTLGAGELDLGQFDRPTRTFSAHGAAMLVKRAVLEEVGPMSDDFFLYYEELDWCERIRRAGFSVWVEPRARVYHKESLTVGTLGPLKTYYLSRNRLFFMRRHMAGGSLALFWIYLMAVMLPKNSLLLALRREWPNLQALWMGVWWNLTGRENRFERMNPGGRGKEKRRMERTA